jgi:hypothetical protein
MKRILIEQTRPSVTCEEHRDEPLDYQCLFCRIRKLEAQLEAVKVAIAKQPRDLDYITSKPTIDKRKGFEIGVRVMRERARAAIGEVDG